jgi:MFS family permease
MLGLRLPPAAETRVAGVTRPVLAIIRQPLFLVAVLSEMAGYGVMNLLMTGAPLAIVAHHGHGLSDAAFVIEWHLVGMFLPGFFTGSLIRRYGTLPIILAGTGLTVIAVFVALHGITVGHFVAALALVGTGWNFMYTGGTTLLTETYAPNEKARTQGLNDLIVFTTMGVSSFASGALVTATGWETMNRAALPVLAIIAFAAAWLMWMRRRVPAAA